MGVRPPAGKGEESDGIELAGPLPHEETDGMPEWEAELHRHSIGLARRSPSDPIPESKTIYFVRHAESMSNVYKRNSKRRPWAMCQLCGVGFNAPLSPEGRAQLARVREPCQKLLSEIEAVLHSPLMRTEETAEVLFGVEDGDLPDTYRPGTSSRDAPWLALQCLKEEKMEEHMQEKGFGVWGGPAASATAASKSALFIRRIEAFLRFAWSSKWSCIALVGHSLWIRVFMQLASADAAPFRVENAHVWRLTLAAPASPDALPRVIRSELYAKP